MSFDLEYVSIEFVKLKDGNHAFKYQLDKTFFDYFGNSDILNADILATIYVEKNGNLMIANIHTVGKIYFSCDRCLENLAMPVDSEFKLIYHLNSELESQENEIKDLYTDVIYLKPSVFKINLAHSIYESSLLSIPMIINCDDFSEENKPCNQEMLSKLNDLHQGAEQETDPRWNELYKLLNKDK